MKTVALLYLCMGKYRVFWKDFYLSSERYFLPECEKFYYVFTDAPRIFGEEDRHVRRIPQEDLGWPDNTLLRFHLFDSQREALGRYDYLFFLNANCLFVAEIPARDFLPEEEELLLVEHPIFYDKPPDAFSYERDPASRACIPLGEGRHYVSGGVNGGKAAAYLAMAAELKARIDQDKANGIVALWHDESHLNRYAYEHGNYRLLSPGYFYPEGWDGPFPPRILAREKTIYFNVDKLKGHRVDPKHKLKHLLRRLTGRMIRF